MALDADDTIILNRLTNAEFTVTDTGNRILITYAYLQGEVCLNSDTGIVYGEYGNQTEWPLAEGDATGAMAWAAKETKKRMIATADQVRAKLIAKRDA